MLMLMGSLAGCADTYSYSLSPEQIARVRGTALPEYELVGEQNIVAFNRAVEATSELRYEAAAGEFWRLISVFEKAGAGRRAAEATFWLAYCYEKLHRSADAKVFYSRCVRKYPGTAGADQAGRRLNRFPAVEGPRPVPVGP